MEQLLVIPPRFRLALAGKALFLLVLAALFVWLGVEALGRWHWPLLARLSAGVLTGAAPLKSRRAGYSLKLPSGQYVEYILHNPWQPLEQGATYTVLYGRRSRVLVAPPEREG